METEIFLPFLFGPIMMLWLGLTILMLTSMWKVFEKAGRKGWEGIVPIYNIVILMKIIRKPEYWILFMLIPLFGIVWQIWSYNLLVKSFGKDEGFTLGLLLLPIVFLPILGFGDAEYQLHKSNDLDLGTSDVIEY